MSYLDNSRTQQKAIRLAVFALTALLITTAVASLALDRKPPVDHDSRRGPLQATFTDAREGLEPRPLTEAEQDKLARARAAIDVAEAAGTRWIEPVAGPEKVFTEADAASKLERYRNLEPQDHSWTAGVARDGQGGER